MYILILLYNYIAHFYEMTTLCINQFVYVGITIFWSFIVNGLDSP
jgi:hypothetical protein